jgi:hypothetical protein
MPKLRVHNFAISVDGYGAGPSALGVGGPRLHEWVFTSVFIPIGFVVTNAAGRWTGLAQRILIIVAWT